MTSFGSSLRQRREEIGVRLEDISEATRVSMRHLQALESEDFKALPGGVFNRGIVRSYAHSVQLDEDETVEAFQAACREHGIAGGEDQSWGEFAKNVSNQRPSSATNRMRWLGAIAMLLAVLIGAVIAYVVLMRRGVVPAPHFHKKTQAEQLRVYPSIDTVPGSVLYS